MEKLIQAIKNNVPVEVGNIVGKELSKRAGILVDKRKKEIALSLFSDEETEESNINSGDSGEESEFIDKIQGIEDNTKVDFKDSSWIVVDKKGAEKFISLYESASDINKERLLHIASKSKRGFLKVIKLIR